MTTHIDGDVFVHQHEHDDSETTFRHMPGGSLRICGRTRRAPAADVEFTTDMMTYTERIGLARFVLRGVPFGPQQTLHSFVAGISGGDTEADRRAYVESFEVHAVPADDVREALRIWVMHQDSQNLTGVWDERVKAYYAARGY